MLKKKKASKQYRHWCNWNNVECSIETNDDGHCEVCKQMIHVTTWKEEIRLQRIVKQNEV